MPGSDHREMHGTWVSVHRGRDQAQASAKVGRIVALTERKVVQEDDAVGRWMRSLNPFILETGNWAQKFPVVIV